MLMHMQSPRGYRFLKKYQILPLPNIRTIRRYLAIIDTKCGFDSNFMHLFAEFMKNQPLINRHGALLVDEISTRKCVSVNSKNLTYHGLVDFGEESETNPSTNITDAEDHGLVIMFKPFAASYMQPIAVFASCETVSGKDLAKIVIKAIAQVEITGAHVHAVITDGAATNRKFWKEVGVSGQKYFKSQSRTTNSKVKNCYKKIEIFFFTRQSTIEKSSYFWTHRIY